MDGWDEIMGVDVEIIQVTVPTIDLWKVYESGVNVYLGDDGRLRTMDVDAERVVLTMVARVTDDEITWTYLVGVSAAELGIPLETVVISEFELDGERVTAVGKRTFGRYATNDDMTSINATARGARNSLPETQAILMEYLRVVDDLQGAGNGKVPEIVAGNLGKPLAVVGNAIVYVGTGCGIVAIERLQNGAVYSTGPNAERFKAAAN